MNAASRAVKITAVFGSFAVALLLGGTALADGSSGPHEGTWILNLEKSQMPDSPMASKSETVTYRYENGEEVYQADAITPTDQHEQIKYRAPYDSEPPYTHIKVTMDGKPAREAPIQLVTLGPRTHLRISMRPDGSFNGIIVRRMSEDGKTLTSSIVGFDSEGRAVVNQTRVYDKKE